MSLTHNGSPFWAVQHFLARLRVNGRFMPPDHLHLWFTNIPLLDVSLVPGLSNHYTHKTLGMVQHKSRGSLRAGGLDGAIRILLTLGSTQQSGLYSTRPFRHMLILQTQFRIGLFIRRSQAGRQAGRHLLLRCDHIETAG